MQSKYSWPFVYSSRSRIEARLRSIFFFNETRTTEIYTLSLHDALPIRRRLSSRPRARAARADPRRAALARPRSEEHTSEFQSRVDLVCRLLLEKKKQEVEQICSRTQKKKRPDI